MGGACQQVNGLLRQCYCYKRLFLLLNCKNRLSLELFSPLQSLSVSSVWRSTRQSVSDSTREDSSQWRLLESFLSSYMCESVRPISSFSLQSWWLRRASVLFTSVFSRLGSSHMSLLLSLKQLEDLFRQSAAFCLELLGTTCSWAEIKSTPLQLRLQWSIQNISKMIISLPLIFWPLTCTHSWNNR